jgi:hypothetical protein
LNLGREGNTGRTRKWDATEIESELGKKIRKSAVGHGYMEKRNKVRDTAGNIKFLKGKKTILSHLIVS